METEKSKSDIAREFFMRGANCAQAVAGAFADEVNMSEAELFKLASGFGGGVARMREVCGAVSGMVIILNLLYGNSDISDKNAKDANYQLTRNLLKQFEKETGSIVCRELLGLDKNAETTPESEARTPHYYKVRPCVELVALAAELLDNYIKNQRSTK